MNVWYTVLGWVSLVVIGGSLFGLKLVFFLTGRSPSRQRGSPGGAAVAVLIWLKVIAVSLLLLASSLITALFLAYRFQAYWPLWGGAVMFSGLWFVQASMIWTSKKIERYETERRTKKIENHNRVHNLLRHGNIEKANRIIERGEVAWDRRDTTKGELLVDTAAHHGNIETLELLRDQGADFYGDYNLEVEDPFNPMVEVNIRHRFLWIWETNISPTVEAFRGTTAHYAARNPDTRNLEWIIEKRDVSPHLTPPKMPVRTPLVDAVKYDSEENTKYLIDRGLPFDSWAFNNPLQHAIKQERPGLIKLLLSSNPEWSECPKPDYEFAPLEYAIKSKHSAFKSSNAEILKLLLEADIPIACPDLKEYRLVNLAVRKEHPEALQALLKRGADPEEQGPYGKQALESLVTSKFSPENQEIARFLIEAGADPQVGIEKAQQVKEETNSIHRRGKVEKWIDFIKDASRN